MENEIIIKQATQNHKRIKKENLFIAYDSHENQIGHGFLIPFFDRDKQPDHPLNIYMDIVMTDSAESEVTNYIKDCLLEKMKIRAHKIKRDYNEKARLYACYLKSETNKIDYFKSRGLRADEGMYVYKIDLHSYDDTRSLQLGYVNFKFWDFKTNVDEYLNHDNHFFSASNYDEKSIEELKKKDGLVILNAYAHNQLIGSITGTEVNTQEGLKVVLLDNLFILKEYRKKGIAKEIVARILSQYKQLNYEEARLELWSANKKAKNLYESFGFTLHEVTQVSVGVNF